MAVRVPECCSNAMERVAPPCEPCRLLMASDAFSGVDARNDAYPTGLDPYEVKVEHLYGRADEVQER